MSDFLPCELPNSPCELLESYRALVECLLCHAPLNCEPMTLAIEDFLTDSDLETNVGTNLLRDLLSGQAILESGVL